MTFERREIDVVELDVDRCLNRYGAGPCTAGTDVATGTSQAGATDTTIVLAAGASGVDDFYNGDAITVADRRAIIADYDGTTKVATVDRKWPVNNLTRSRQFDHADWTRSGIASVTADAIAAPDGLLAADLVVEDGAAGVHQVSQSLAYSSGQQYALAAKVRSAGRDLVLDFGAGAFPAAASASFDLVNGTRAVGAGADQATIRKLCDGYWLCVLIATANATASSTTSLGLYNGAASYAGDGQSGLYLAAAHHRKADQSDDFIEAVATAIGLPDGIAYRIVEVGGECYHTFETCQDKANYLRGRQCWPFCTVGAPVPAELQIRPYIRRAVPASTDLAVEKGLATRGKVTIDLLDEPSTDIEADPYHATRPIPAAGSFFGRLLARSPNIVGRFARFRRAHFVGGWAEAEFIDGLYVVDSIAGPDGTGQVDLVLKDPIKLADRAKIPAPSSGQLAVALSVADTRLQLRPGDGLDYPYWTGTVRIGDELIAYTNREVVKGWNFNNDNLESFQGFHATLAAGEFFAELTSTDVDPQLWSPNDIGLNGLRNRYVAARIRRTAGTAWAGQCRYATAAHGFSASYYKAVTPDPTLAGQWVVVTWDMHDLDAGGTDWQNSIVRRLSLNLGASVADVFEVDWIAFDTPAPVSSDILALTDTTFRGQWGTTAAAGDAGDAVQLCTTYQNVPAWQVLQDLLLQSQIPANNINSAELQAEDETWLGESFQISAVLSEPESASKLIQELALQIGGFVWWDAVAQQVRFQVFSPLAVGETIAATLTADGDVVERSVRVRVRDELRRTAVQIWYDRVSQTADLGELVNYRRYRVHVDADAENANLYGDVRPEIIASRWLSAQNDAAVAAQAYRRLAFYRKAPKNIDIRLDMKDRDLWVGDVIDLEIDQLTDAAGVPLVTRCLIIRRHDDPGRVNLTLLPMAFGIRVAFIAPDTGAAYPADDEYVHICPDSGFFADGSPGYQPF